MQDREFIALLNRRSRRHESALRASAAEYCVIVLPLRATTSPVSSRYRTSERQSML
jgi:hypothetical protein